jgi:monoamine oxidase
MHSQISFHSDRLLREADVVVIGAGAAGIAAARRLRAQGLTAVIVEARDRVGGRAHTIPLRGQAVDIGAHWLHAAGNNGLIAQAKQLGLMLFDAPQEPLLMIGAREADSFERAAFAQRWEDAEDAILGLASGPTDQPAAAALEAMREEANPFDDTIAFMHGAFDSGVSLDALGAVDFAAAQDDEDRFVEGGYGALIAMLARDLPVALATPATRIDWSGSGVVVETARGSLRAACAIVTMPIPLLQAGVLRFFPEIPLPSATAIDALRPALYEHIVMSWPGGPFREGANRTVAFAGDSVANLGLLANFDGGDLHYADLGGALLRDLPSEGDRAAFVRDFLSQRFGCDEAARIDVLAASAWTADPWSACAWTYAPPGAHGARAVLQQPVAERIFFAGEATSLSQWGTIGGAWAEGERAAMQTATVLAKTQPNCA